MVLVVWQGINDLRGWALEYRPDRHGAEYVLHRWGVVLAAGRTPEGAAAALAGKVVARGGPRTDSDQFDLWASRCILANLAG